MNTGWFWEKRKAPALFFFGSTVLTIVAVLLLRVLWIPTASGSDIAPEAERTLAAQADLPFQIFIPGFLPKQIQRAEVRIESSGLRPGEKPVIRLVYPTRGGQTLTIEQTPGEESDSQAPLQVMTVACHCQCQTGSLCQPGEIVYQIGSWRVTVSQSEPNILTLQELNMAVETMGPAANQQAYTNMESIPLSELAPPAVDILPNEAGVQEFTLVVTPNGYQPAHFAVTAGVPVRLNFHQVGYVNCGCHILEHEDMGMMRNIMVMGAAM